MGYRRRNGEIGNESHESHGRTPSGTTGNPLPEKTILVWLSQTNLLIRAVLVSGKRADAIAKLRGVIQTSDVIEFSFYY